MVDTHYRNYTAGNSLEDVNDLRQNSILCLGYFSNVLSVEQLAVDNKTLLMIYM